MIQRLAAVAAAIALVAGAFVIRDTVIENDAASREDDAAPVVCARELADVCDEAAAVDDTFEAVVGGDDEVVWVTPGPWPQMANEALSFRSEPEAFERTTAVASTRLIVVIRRHPPECPGAITWRCIGDAARGGQTRVAGPSPANPYRLLIRAALLSGYFDRSDYASNDVLDDAAASDWIASVERGIDRGRSFGATTLADFIAQRGSADVFISTDADGGQFASTTVEVATPTPVVRIDATVGSDGDVPATVAQALRAKRWDEPAQTDEDDGLPSPGVLLALREVGS